MNPYGTATTAIAPPEWTTDSMMARFATIASRLVAAKFLLSGSAWTGRQQDRG
jgi:hypothetical protein